MPAKFHTPGLRPIRQDDLRSSSGRSSEDRRKMKARRILFIRARADVQPERILLQMREAELYSPKTTNCDAIRFINRTLKETAQ